MGSTMNKGQRPLGFDSILLVLLVLVAIAIALAYFGFAVSNLALSLATLVWLSFILVISFYLIYLWQKAYKGIREGKVYLDILLGVYAVQIGYAAFYILGRSLDPVRWPSSKAPIVSLLVAYVHLLLFTWLKSQDGYIANLPLSSSAGKALFVSVLIGVHGVGLLVLTIF
jgi:cation transport ATPase